MCKLITIRETCERTSLSCTTLWRLVRDGQFPAPIAFGQSQRKAFVEAEVTAYIEARIAEREKARSAA